MKTFKLSLESPEIEFPATIEVFLRENIEIDSKPLPTVIICPGGGYDFLSARESEPIALSFLAQGFQAIILNYTTMGDGIKENFLNSTILQVAKTFELIHQNQEEWQMDTHNIFLIGFSAGGHLAASYSTSWQTFENDTTSVNYQPKGAILCYPVIGFEYGWPQDLSYFKFPLGDPKQYDTSKKVTPQTPDTFIWHTADDALVSVSNTLRFCEKLTENSVKFECHIFESGEHGLSLATRSSSHFLTDNCIVPEVASWFTSCISWIERRLD